MPSAKSPYKTTDPRAQLYEHLRSRFMADGGDVADDDEEQPGPVTEAPTTPPSLDKDLDPVASAPQAQPATPPSDDDKRAALTAALQAKYGQAADPSGVQAALETRRQQNNIANIGQALQQFVQARGVAAGLKPDYSGWDHLRQQGEQGVQTAQAQRQQSIQDFLQKNALQEQVARNMREQGSYDQKMAAEKFALQQEQDSARPDSDKSKTAVSLAEANFPHVFDGLTDAQKAGLTYNDIKNIGLPATEAATRDKMAVEAARARLQTQLSEKQRQADTAFAGQFGKLSQDYNKAKAELDNQAALTDQAAHSNGGIAGALVKGGALHEALGRVSQGELGMAVDPSLVERAKRLWGQISEGKSLTDKDVQEYQAIQKAARDSLDQRFKANADQATSSYDRAQKQPEGYAAGLVGWKGLPKAAASTSTSGNTTPTHADLLAEKARRQAAKAGPAFPGRTPAPEEDDNGPGFMNVPR